MSFRQVAYRLYAARLRWRLRNARLPRHIGLIIDGNRRWAKQEGLASPSDGHRHGAGHIWDALAWCQTAGIQHVSVFICSAENLARRDDAEVAALMEIIEQIVLSRIATPDPAWQVHVAGMVDMLPDEHRARAQGGGRGDERLHDRGPRHPLRRLRRTPGDRRGRTRLARGTGCRRRKPADPAANAVQQEDIARHLAGAGQPEPDLIIRTSGEQRMSNFMLWQGTDAYLHFCDCYWPAFREVDFLRALRDFAARQYRQLD